MKKLFLTLICVMASIALHAQFLVHQNYTSTQGTALKSGFVYDAEKKTWLFNGIDVSAIDSVTVAKDITEQLSQETILKKHVYRLIPDNNDYSTIIDSIVNGIIYLKNTPALAQRKLLQAPRRVASRNSRGVVSHTTVWETAPVQLLSQVPKDGYIIIPAQEMSEKDFFIEALKGDELTPEEKLRLYGGCVKIQDAQYGAGSIATMPISIYEACEEVSIQVEKKEYDVFELLFEANTNIQKSINLPLTKREDDRFDVELQLNRNKREISVGIYYAVGKEGKKDLIPNYDYSTAKGEKKMHLGLIFYLKPGENNPTKVGYDLRSNKGDNKISYVKTTVETDFEIGCDLEMGGEIDLKAILGKDWSEIGQKIFPSIPIPGLSVVAGIGGTRLGAFLDVRAFLKGKVEGNLSLNLFKVKPILNFDVLYDNETGLRTTEHTKRDFNIQFFSNVNGQLKGEAEVGLGIGPALKFDIWGKENKLDILFGARAGIDINIPPKVKGNPIQMYVGGLLQPSLDLFDVISIRRNFLKDLEFRYPDNKEKSLPKVLELVRNVDNDFEFTVNKTDRLVWIKDISDRYEYSLTELKSKKSPPFMRTLQLKLHPLKKKMANGKDTLYLSRISNQSIVTIDTLLVRIESPYFFKDKTGTRSLDEVLPVKLGQRNQFYLLVHPRLKETSWWKYFKPRFTTIPSDKEVDIVSIKRSSEYENITWEQYKIEIDVPIALPAGASILFKDEYSGHTFDIILEAERPIPVVEGLNAYYPFDYNANDASGHGLHGTVSGATHVREGNNGYYAFDGDGQYIEVPPSPLHSQLNVATVCAWLYVDKYYTSSDGTKWFNLLCHSQINTTARGPWCMQFVPDELPVGEWVHFAYTYDNNGSQVYINGKPSNRSWWSSLSPSLYYQNSNLELLIGANPPGLPEYNYGKMDEIFIYNRRLSDEEIQAIYRAGVAKGLGLQSLPPKGE